MREVCKPVGMRAMAIGKENGWQVRQVASKFRYRRINVETGCLACHGRRDSRPGFVKANDPDDKAFDFKPGDQRGMYAVYLQELKEAIAINPRHRLIL